ncbi:MULTISPECIES: S1 family peptidase [Exiguobacterium]|uniref:S1 family peptidase n=1 Tax=Exiguobacterium TaxID=33986 RepID=UPI001BE4F9DB|nr:MULTISPECIES: serine protease [Exiguobacterium]MCT4776350.1 serine protease [Exiguobacterium aquaticum]MCT4789371.1 serine protease [Exiguobacterium mexicanum]
MDIFNFAVYSVIRIECDNGLVGTGFFFSFLNKKVHKISADSETPYITIVTNKHVIENGNNIKIIFSKEHYNQSWGTKSEVFKLNYPLKNHVIMHSDPDIDLCAIKITNALNYISSPNPYFEPFDAYFEPLSIKHIPDESQLEELNYVEDVLMVGYPNGLYDEKNNLPIFRRGITATHSRVDFEGLPECLIDMYITGGSSGSPVFLNFTNTKERDRKPLFLGILKGVMIKEIMELDDSQSNRISKFQIEINLGIVIKAKSLWDIQKQIYSL